MAKISPEVYSTLGCSVHVHYRKSNTTCRKEGGGGGGSGKWQKGMSVESGQRTRKRKGVVLGILHGCYSYSSAGGYRQPCKSPQNSNKVQLMLGINGTKTTLYQH